MQNELKEQTNKIIYNIESKVSDIAHKSKPYIVPVEMLKIFINLLFIEVVSKQNTGKTLSEYFDNTLNSDFREKFLNYILVELQDTENTNENMIIKDAYEEFEIIDNISFNALLEILENVNFTALNNKSRSNIIEALFDSISEYSQNDSEFANRSPINLRKFILDIMEPKQDDKIIDFTCGTGSFLIEANNYINKNSNGVGKNLLVGYDINREMQKISNKHAILAGMKNVSIARKDILKEYKDLNVRNRFDKVFFAPPFNVKVSPEDVSESFSIKARNADILFLEAAMMSLQPLGSAAIVVPGSTLYSTSKPYKLIRQNLIDDFCIEAVISLPIKYKNMNVPLFLLVFKNFKIDSDILFIDLSSTKKENTIDKLLSIGLKIFKEYKLSNYKNDFYQCDNELVNNRDLFWLVEKKRILENDYRIDPLFYKPMKKTLTRPVNEIFETLQNKLSKIEKEVNELEKEVRLVNKIEKNKFIKKSIFEICEITQGKPLPREVKIDNGNLPWVQIKDMTNSNGFTIESANKNVSEEFAINHNLRIVEKNTLLLSIRGTIGIPVITDKRMCIGPNIAILVPKDDFVDIWFLFGFFMNKRDVLKEQINGIIPSLTVATLRSIEIEVPPVSIQQSLSSGYMHTLNNLKSIKQLFLDSNSHVDEITNAIYANFLNKG